MSRSLTSRLLMSACAVSALAIASTAANAGGFANRQQSATGQGFSFAGAGTSAFGLGSMFWNPANITNFEGRRSEWNLSLIAPDSRVDTTGVRFAPLNIPGAAVGIPNNSSGNINQAVVSPASYNSYQLNDRFWIGLQSGSPFGSTTKPENGFAGSVYGSMTKVRATALTPTIGYKMNDMISFGFGVTLQQLNVTLKNGDARWLGLAPGILANNNIPAQQKPALLAALGRAASQTELKGDGYGIGFTGGVTLKPFQGTEISLGYRSSIRHKLEGHILSAANNSETLIQGNVNLPEIVTLGLKQDINAQWTVTGTAQWTNWSRFNIVPITSRVTGAPVTQLGFKYQDEYFFALGAEYRYSDQLKLRAGIAYELSPVKDETRSVRVLDNNRLWLSAGLGYKFTNQLEFDLGYSFLKLSNGKIDMVSPGNALNPVGNPAANAAFDYSGTTKGHVHILSASLKYRWDAPAASTAPIIKKF